MKIALGTAQFGLDYGVSNSQGQVTKPEIDAILKQALSLGIDTLDCAGAYGNSEKILGQLNVSQNFNLISKIPRLSNNENNIEQLLSQSLADLQSKHLSALLLHHANNLLEHPDRNKIFCDLDLLKKKQKVNRIGVSVYHPEQLLSILKYFDIDLVQAPVNFFDQRFISADIISICKKKNIKLHARSLFLQGVLLMTNENMPRYFKPYQEKLLAYSHLAKSLACSKLTLALAILAQNSPNKSNDEQAKQDVFEKLVIGVCNRQQLHEVAEAYHQAQNLSFCTEELKQLADTRAGLINPSLWQL